MAPPPVLLLPRWLLVVGGVRAAAKPRSFSNYSLPGIGLGSSRSANSGSTRSRSSRRFSSNAEQSTTGSQRRWWSDEAAQFDDKDEEFEEDEEEGFSFGGGSASSWGLAFDEPWFTKASRAYGYVLPVVLVSMLAASGPQAFLMAMAIPLAQSAVSLAIRSFSNTSFNWGSRNQEEYDDDYAIIPITEAAAGRNPNKKKNTATPSPPRPSIKIYSSSSRSQQRQPWAKGGKSEEACRSNGGFR